MIPICVYIKLTQARSSCHLQPLWRYILDRYHSLRYRLFVVICSMLVLFIWGKIINLNMIWTINYVLALASMSALRQCLGKKMYAIPMWRWILSIFFPYLCTYFWRVHSTLLRAFSSKERHLFKKFHLKMCVAPVLWPHWIVRAIF